MLTGAGAMLFSLIIG